MNIVNSRFKFSFSVAFVTILVLSSFYLFNINKVSASENDDSERTEIEQNNFEISVDSPYSIKQLDGSILFFDNEEDYNSYLENNIEARCATCNQTTQTLVSSYTLNKQFINYHPLTASWTNATGYALSSGKTYSISGALKIEEYTVTATVTHSVGVTTTIKADDSKLSRLGVYSDIKFSRYKNVVKNPIGQVIETYYSNFATPINAPYILVVYK